MITPIKLSRKEKEEEKHPPPLFKNEILIKVGVVGDPSTGKTELIRAICGERFDEDYISTLSVFFMEKSILINRTRVTFSLWDLGSSRTFIVHYPLVCNGADAIIFTFDLTRKSTLQSIKQHYLQARQHNKTMFPLLVGSKWDSFIVLPKEEQEEIIKLARRYAKAMKAPLIFCSASHSININKIYKLIACTTFNLKVQIKEIKNDGEPLLEYYVPNVKKSSNDSSNEQKN